MRSLDLKVASNPKFVIHRTARRPNTALPRTPPVLFHATYGFVSACLIGCAGDFAGKRHRWAAGTKVLLVDRRKGELFWPDGGKKKIGTRIYLGHVGIIMCLFAHSRFTSTRPRKSQSILSIIRQRYCPVAACRVLYQVANGATTKKHGTGLRGCRYAFETRVNGSRSRKH